MNIRFLIAHNLRKLADKVDPPKAFKFGKTWTKPRPLELEPHTIVCYVGGGGNDHGGSNDLRSGITVKCRNCDAVFNMRDVRFDGGGSGACTMIVNDGPTRYMTNIQPEHVAAWCDHTNVDIIGGFTTAVSKGG